MSPLRTLKLRHDAFLAIRAFFIARGYLEVDTPLVVAGPGLEPHLDPIALALRARDDAPPERRWLITSPELSMKKLVAQGAPRIFQLSHVFRDGETTARHHPEFTLLEWYQAGLSLDGMRTETEELVRHVARALGCAELPAFHEATVQELFKDVAGIALDVQSDSALVDAARARGMTLRPGADFEDAFFQVMGDVIEPAIAKRGPTFVSRWPAQMAVLARKCEDDARYAERFELYAGGLELCNAFFELTDAHEQRARFLADNDKRAALGKERLPLDEEFLALLAHMPPTSGNALGVDRLLMFLTGTQRIDDVMLR
jgi:elongation factor P--(R)-beta-lysine ligase